MIPQIRHFAVVNRKIAYRLRSGRGPTLVFLPGYGSDMEGTKALALDAFAERRGLGMLRLDYSGTGRSSGDFEHGTLASWLEESLEAIDQLTEGPLILVGSSMGGWIALHLALLRSDRMHSLVGIAVAPDFTDWGFTDAQKAKLRERGRLEQQSPSDPQPQLFTLSFWESGQRLRLLDKPIDINCPARLIHGDMDPDVPLEIALRTLRSLRSGDVQLVVIKDGGHRLSRPHEIDAILRTLAGLLEPAE